jgi:hypothetical protein
MLTEPGDSLTARMKRGNFGTCDNALFVFERDGDVREGY